NTDIKIKNTSFSLCFFRANSRPCCFLILKRVGFQTNANVDSAIFTAIRIKLATALYSPRAALPKKKEMMYLSELNMKKLIVRESENSTTYTKKIRAFLIFLLSPTDCIYRSFLCWRTRTTSDTNNATINATPYAFHC